MSSGALKQTMLGPFSWRRLGNMFSAGEENDFRTSSRVAQADAAQGPNNNQRNPSRCLDSTNVLSHCVENVYQAAEQGSEVKAKKTKTVVHMLAVLLAAIELLVLL